MADPAPKFDEQSLCAQLKELLEDMLSFVDSASEDEQRRLLRWLEGFKEDDRRRHVRKACSISASVGTWRVFPESISNISCGGVFIKTSTPYLPGERLVLTLSPPNENLPIRITGRVVRQGPEGAAVEFTTPPSKELTAMVECL
jgi:hypothetical protein